LGVPEAEAPLPPDRRVSLSGEQRCHPQIRAQHTARRSGQETERFVIVDDPDYEYETERDYSASVMLPTRTMIEFTGIGAGSWWGSPSSDAKLGQRRADEAR